MSSRFFWGALGGAGAGKESAAAVGALKGRVESCLAEGHTTREIQVVGL